MLDRDALKAVAGVQVGPLPTHQGGLLVWAGRSRRGTAVFSDHREHPREIPSRCTSNSSGSRWPLPLRLPQASKACARACLAPPRRATPSTPPPSPWCTAGAPRALSPPRRRPRRPSWTHSSRCSPHTPTPTPAPTLFTPPSGLPSGSLLPACPAIVQSQHGSPRAHGRLPLCSFCPATTALFMSVSSNRPTSSLTRPTRSIR